MAKSLDLTTMSLLVICLAISVGTSYAHDSAPAPSGDQEGGSNNEQFVILLEKSLQVSFELIEEGKNSEAEMKLQDIGRLFMGYKGMPIDEKMAKLSEIVSKIKKSFNKKTQAAIEDFLGGMQMGAKLSVGGNGGSGQENSPTSVFEILLEQKLKTAFQTLEHGNQAEGQKMLQVIGNIVAGFKSIPKQEKLDKLYEITMKIKPSFDKETQAAVEEFAGGIQFGAKFIINHTTETGDYEESSDGPTPN